MATGTPAPRAWTPPIALLVVLAVAGVPYGLFGSVFGPYYPMIVGIVLAGTGVGVMVAFGARWGRVPLVFGIAVIVGALLYVAIGLLTPDGSGNGSGSGCMSGGTCEQR